MSMTKKLTKHGNSFAIVIDKPILDLLGIDSETSLEISTPDGETIVIKPVKDKTIRRKLKSSLKKINKKYSKVLKNLAE